MRSGHALLLTWLGGVLLYWHWLAAGSLSLCTVVCLFSFIGTAYLIGDVFLKLALRDDERFDNLPVRLVLGLLLADVALYLAVLVLPFGPALNWGLLVIAALTVWVLVRRGPAARAAPTANRSEIIFLLLAPVAVTLWCRELLPPLQPDGPDMMMRAWQDVYSHVCLIGNFAVSRGAATISDYHGAGIAAPPYHYAIYMLPAALVDGAGVSGLSAYAGLMVPLGLLAAAAAGYGLAAAVFGRWPALAGGLALLLLPDAVQQGAGNSFFGFEWMLQSAPACGYGLAGAVVVFALLQEACRTGRHNLVALAWFFVGVTLLHKAQIFFAIAYLALIFPVCFFPGVTPRRRALGLLLFTAIYWGVIVASQSVPGVPVIRLDGSGLMGYSQLILGNQAGGFLRQTASWLFAHSAGNWPYRAAVFALLLTVVTFGLYSILYLVQLRQLRRTDPTRVWMFPLLVGGCYLLMATCLAMDDRQLGTGVELLHRPFVWAYCVMVVWTGAVTYRRFFQDGPPPTAMGRLAVSGAALALLLVPAVFGPGIQTMKQWGIDHQRLPAGLMAAAGFIRENSAQGEMVQDAREGVGVILSALTERQAFALSTNGSREPAEMVARRQVLQELSDLTDGRQAEAVMRKNRIRWYLINPGDQVPWIDSIGRPPVFQRDGYRVYRF